VGKHKSKKHETMLSKTWYRDRMIVEWPEGIAGLQTGCRAGVHARIGSGSIA
jgi:hypothetical protein